MIARVLCFFLSLIERQFRSWEIYIGLLLLWEIHIKSLKVLMGSCVNKEKISENSIRHKQEADPANPKMGI